MKIYICPNCGRLTAASRKREVFCSKCDEMLMEKVRLTFEKYTSLNEQERKDYAESWLYIHRSEKRM